MRFPCAAALLCRVRRISSSRRLASLFCAPLALGLMAQPAAAQVQRPLLPQFRVPARSLVTSRIDRSRTVAVPGAVHPALHLQKDLGPVSDTLPVEHIQLVLQRPQERQAAFDALVAAQQQPGSPAFHQWLTPAQIGAEFGPSDADLATVRSYLESEGFTVNHVSKSGTTIDFSGNAGQVAHSFGTQIHSLVAPDGERRYGAVSEAHMPEALLPLVRGFVSLSSIPARPLAHRAAPRALNGNDNDLGPQDFYKIYNAGVPILSGLNGKGFTIALVEQSNINTADVTAFRQKFNVNPATPQLVVQHGSTSVTCADPGVQNTVPVPNDETEAVLDAEWAGALAPQSKLLFVSCATTTATTGAILAAEAVVDDNLADLISVSFGRTENGDATEAGQISSLWEQAAAQGQTVIVAAGDSGSDVADDGATIGTNGVNVNVYGSSNYNLSAGGTDFQDVYNQQIDAGTSYGTSKFWNSSAGTGGLNATGYVPETTWNGSCASSLSIHLHEGATANAVSLCNDSAQNRATQGSNSLLIPAGGGGGQSQFTSRPAWQTGTVFGLPSTSSAPHRVVPDISLFASAGVWNHALLAMQSDFQADPFRMGGTSFVAPQLAGIFADLAQKVGGRLGNVAPQLYTLAAKAYGTTSFSGDGCNGSGASGSGETSSLPYASCIFHDVQTGNNAVACTPGTPNCYAASGQSYGITSSTLTAATPAYSTGQGWDFATGLGSIDVNNLLNAWQAPTAGSLTLAVAPVAIAAPQGNVPFTATLSWSSGPVPSGTVGFELDNNNVMVDSTCSGTSSPVTCTVAVNLSTATVGQHTISAYYAGDANYPPSTATAILVIGPISSFPAQLIGTSSAAYTVTVSVPPASTVTGYQAFGEGVHDSEFTMGPGGTCQTGYFPNGTTCTATVIFKPQFPGVRKGAIVATGSTLAGQNPVPLYAASFFSGTGQGAQGLFTSPFSYAMWGGPGNGTAPVNLNQEWNSFAVDAAGNIFIGDNAPLGPGYDQISKVAGTVTPFGPPGGTAYGSPFMATQTISCVAVDAGGTVYFGDSNLDRITAIQPNGSWTEVVTPTALNNGPVEGCGIDGQGNLLIGRYYKGFFRINLTTFATSFVTTQHHPYYNLTADAAGNVYFLTPDPNNVNLQLIATYTAQGVESTQSTPLYSMTDLQADPAGNLYILGNYNNSANVPNTWGIYEIPAGTTTLVPIVTGLPQGGYIKIAPNSDIYYLEGHSASMTRFARSEGAVNFQPVPLGSTSAPTDVLLSNNGNQPLQLSGLVADAGVVITGSDTTCTSKGVLAPNASCTLGVQFQPAVNGPFVGNVLVTDNDLNFGKQQRIVVQGSTPANTQTITFPPLTSPAQVNSTATLAATASSNLPITYQVTGPATLSGTTLTYTGAGTVTVTATQSGNSTYQAAVPVSQTITVQNPQVATTTTLTASANAVFGSSVTLTATVAPPNGSPVPTGSVTFTSGSATLGTSALDSHGVATLVSSALPAGTDTVVASYAGDSGDQASASAPLTITVAQAGSSVTLAANPGTSSYGTPATFTATVSGASSSAPAATGTVTFLDGTTTLGTATLANGSASVTPSPLAPGTHSLTATFSGDNNYTAATSAALSFVVAKDTASVTLSGPSTIAYGASLPLQVAVTNGGATPPSGTITVLEGSSTLGTGTLSNGAATVTLTGLASGTHTLTASYAGDATNNTATSTPLSVSVTPAATSTTLAASASTLNAGSTLTLSATVAHSTGTTAPTGTVTFFDGTAQIGTGTLNASSAASFSTSTLAAGTHNLTARYSGDAAYAASASSATTVTVNTIATTTQLTASASRLVIGASLSLTVNVTAANGTPAGTVTFTDGTTTLGTATLSNGAASFSTSTLAIGTHSITASYAGNGTFAASASSSTTITVTGLPDFTVTASPNTLTIASGSSASTVLTFTPINGYAGTIQPSCGTLPQYVSCTFAPSTVSFSATAQTAQNVTLTISTVSSHAALDTPGLPGALSRRLELACAVPLLLLSVFGRRQRRRAVPFLLALRLGVLASGITGCGGSAAAAPVYKTAPGNYSVPVSISDGSTSHSLNLTVTVQ